MQVNDVGDTYQHQDEHLFADALETNRRRQLPVDDGAHDPTDVVQGHQHDQGDHQAVQAAQEVSEPSPDGCNSDLYFAQINASNRLLKTEHFVQAINIYYSCVAAIVTVLSLIYPDGNYSIASAIMTIALAISIVYLNAQKYGNRAQQLQTNYLALHQLRFDIENAIRERKENCACIDIKSFQKRYVDLLQTSENHIDQDFRKTMWEKDHKRKNRMQADYVHRLVGIECVKFYLILNSG